MKRVTLLLARTENLESNQQGALNYLDTITLFKTLQFEFISNNY